MVRILINTARRLALKIASYGLMHLIVAILVAYALTRDWRIALAIGTVEPLVQTVFFTLHDRLWSRLEARRIRRSKVSPTGAAIVGQPAAPIH
jgi:uncharacterized membrane protein